MAWIPTIPFVIIGRSEVNWPQLTQIEACVGIGWGARVGFNPGELADLLLGFAGIDIYGDDLERRKKRDSEDHGEP